MHTATAPAVPVGEPTSRLLAGPREPAWLQTLRWARDPVRFFTDCARRHGPTFTVQLMGDDPTVVFSEPEAIRQILGPEGEGLLAGAASRDFLAPILGRESILVHDGPRHDRKRRLMLPPFHGERMLEYGGTIRDVTDRVVDAWPVGRPFPAHPEMQAITLDVIIRTVFGLEDSAAVDRLRSCLLRMLRVADGAAAIFLAVPVLRFEAGGLLPWGRFVRARNTVRAMLLAEIAARRAAPADRRDILSLLLAARDEAGQPMSEEEILDEMLTLLNAGHETTAASLTWVLGHVLPRPRVLERVRGELHAVTGGGPVEPAHAGKLPYLDAVIKESARLTPTFTTIVRQLEAPRRIGGVDLPAGARVIPSIQLAHHRAESWPEPERFGPERFLGERPHPFAFFPFGGGTRRCLGAAFANYEMKLVLARVLSRVDMHVEPGYRLESVFRGVAVAPARGLPVVVTARR